MFLVLYDMIWCTAVVNVAGWKPQNLHHLLVARVVLVGSALHGRCCISSHNTRRGTTLDDLDDLQIDK